MNDNQADIVEEMLRKYGEPVGGHLPTNDEDYIGSPYRYYMVVECVSNQTGRSTYYEGSDDLDELYEQAGNILHDNMIDLSYGVLAHPVAIVDTMTGKVLAPMLPSVIQFRETSSTIIA